MENFGKFSLASERQKPGCKVPGGVKALLPTPSKVWKLPAAMWLFH
jgi:hypothetical protein